MTSFLDAIGKDIIFTSYCFGDQYLAQQERLRESIKGIYPNANLLFINEAVETGKPKFQQSMYGFKVALVNECRRLGYKKIIFLDTSIVLKRPVNEWFELVKQYGVLAPIDRRKLQDTISDQCLNFLSISREYLADNHLVGGSIYVFDFDVEKCQRVFAMWEQMESKGIFGTKEDLEIGKLADHRMDESCMAAALMLNGVFPVTHSVMKYAVHDPDTGLLLNCENPIAIKKHFK